MIRRGLLSVVALLFVAMCLPNSGASRYMGGNEYLQELICDEEGQLYDALELSEVIGYEAFVAGLHGYQKVKDKSHELLTLIDFTKPSTEERMAVIDMSSREVLCTSLVAHGRNSGDVYATRFSNREGSFMSSLGFYLTGNTYHGRNGYSLRLFGLEDGVNDKAYKRAIVVHGADYCDPRRIGQGQRLGRSLGCPALPPQVARQVIDVIKGGSVLFIYAEDQWYQSHSSYLTKA